MRSLDLADFLLIAEIHSGIAANQLARIPWVVSLAEAALAAPFSRVGEYEAFPALHEKAAVYCARIVAYHPLPDGNKRTAYDVMREFLDRNGVAFSHPPEGLLGTAEVIEELAANLLSDRDFFAWMLERTGD